MFAQTPQDTRRVVELGRPDAMNPEERWVANMLTKPLVLVGGASLVATAFVAAWIYSKDLQTFLVPAVGLPVLAVLSSSLPIAWARTRDNNTIVARLSLGLWIACVFMNVIVMLYFALYVPAPKAPAVQAAALHRAQPAVSAPHLSGDEIERLDDEIRWRWYLVNDYGEELATAKGAKRERLLSAENRRRYAIAKTELEQFEIRRYGAPVVMKDLDPSRNGPGQLEVQGYAASSGMVRQLRTKRSVAGSAQTVLPQTACAAGRDCAVDRPASPGARNCGNAGTESGHPCPRSRRLSGGG